MVRKPKAYVPTCNSDTHGELEDYVYTFRTSSNPRPHCLVSKAIPCSKVIEGIASIPSNDKEYMRKLGYVWDETYKKYRHQTPLEYEEKQKKYQLQTSK